MEDLQRSIAENPNNPHRCRLVKNFPNSQDWGHWRLWYYPIFPGKRRYVDIPGAWNSDNGWRSAQYVEMAIRNNHPLHAIISAAKGDYKAVSSKRKNP